MDRWMHRWMDEWKKTHFGDLFKISFMGIIHKLPHTFRGKGGIVFIQQKCISKGGSIASIPFRGSNPTQGKLVGTNFHTLVQNCQNIAQQRATKHRRSTHHVRTFKQISTLRGIAFYVLSSLVLCVVKH